MANTKQRILVVDDAPTVTEFVRYALTQKGYEVHVATNGNDALYLAKNNSYDLFILDIRLPDIDGLSLCKSVKALSPAPVLFLSAHNTIDDKVAGLETGADDYLTKPFGINELIARIRALLRRASHDFSHCSHL